ncbi:MAG: hypothetical protein JOZ31_13210 [Verrucomicrobia bacterium]|nr:hypothetical protein [Verrucomicrobiota bacterium]MBV8482588.1 hypothetical protein [Verrucomicrobiota bacterium]
MPLSPTFLVIIGGISLLPPGCGLLELSAPVSQKKISNSGESAPSFWARRASLQKQTTNRLTAIEPSLSG